jgi:hypothetical protein
MVEREREREREKKTFKNDVKSWSSEKRMAGLLVVTYNLEHFHHQR